MKRFKGHMLTFLVIPMLVCGCTKSKVMEYRAQAIPTTNAATPATNLLSNPDFITEFPGRLPEQWSGDFEYGDYTSLAFTNEGLKFEKNATGKFFLYQKVRVLPGKFYKAAVVCDYSIYNYNQGGVYVMDGSMEKVLGKVEKVNESGSGSLELVFNSGSDSLVTLAVGFFGGMNASILLKNASVTPYRFIVTPGNSAFARALTDRLMLNFNQVNFARSVESISDYVNGALLCEYHNGDCTDRIKRLSAILENRGDYYYFPKNLAERSDIIDSYCQRSSLSLDEILSNEFNIPVRQVHMVFDGVGKHQFMEYWNPYLNKWVAIDPCFSCTYSKDGIPLSVAEIKREDLPVVMKIFGSNFYYTTLDELLEFWHTMDAFEIKTDYYITYPYGNNEPITRKMPKSSSKPN